MNYDRLLRESAPLPEELRLNRNAVTAAER